jgi:type VI secretion system protein ImpL
MWIDVKKLTHLGPILLIGAALLALGGTLYFTTDHTAIYRWADANRVILSALVCMLGALAYWVYPKRASIEKEAENLIIREQLAPVAQADIDAARAPAASVLALAGIDALGSALRSEGRVWWRYRRPFFLLVGNAATINTFLPDIVGKGWLVNDDAALLSSKPGPDGRPDEHWLRQIYLFRRLRPIDAVVLVLDGTDDLSPRRRGSSAYSVNLSRIAHVLHWSAPVYVLDVAETDAFNNGRTALLGCEFAPDANERAVESTLLELRSRIGHMSIGQLIRSYKDQYSAQLSQRLDTRSAPLAAMIASLGKSQGAASVGKRRILRAVSRLLPMLTIKQPIRTRLDGADLADMESSRDELLASSAARRMGWHPVTVFSTIALGVIGLWIAGMVVSGMTNGRDLIEAQQTIQTLKTAPDPRRRCKPCSGCSSRLIAMKIVSPISRRYGVASA